MKLHDFLAIVLQSHANALVRLAALFGEDVLIEMLELSGERERADELKADPAWISKTAQPATAARTDGATQPRSPYRTLEGAVREIGLHSTLEFHLWAYPFYRCLIEANFDLDAELVNPKTGGIPIVEAAVAQSEAWVRGLPIPPALSIRAEQAVRTPWMRFRTETYRRMGQRPIGVVP